MRIANRSEVNLIQTGAPPADRTLRVAEAGHQTALQALTTGFVGVTDLSRVTMVELCDALRRMIDAPGNVRVRCDLDLHPRHTADTDDPTDWTDSSEGRASEFSFGPPGSRRMWVGDSAGRLYRSRDDGESWKETASPFAERHGAIEAIAVRPDNPAHVVAAVYAEGAQPAPAAFLYRSETDGDAWQAAANPIVDATGARVGVRALEFDPGAPPNLYAATDVGVFHSADGGDTWVAFNEGMPNVRISDLAMEPTTRMLRAGAWGRGVYERHLGSRPPKDVRLHIRSTALDDGTAQPYPGPDLSAVTATSLRLDTSPDIKQLRRDPRRGLLLDGVEFDEEVRTTDVRTGPAFVGVQVHNRGAFTTSTARVALLWAPADIGPPLLPNEIRAPFAAVAAVAVGTRFGAWTVLADGTLPDPQNIGHNLVAPGLSARGARRYFARVLVAGGRPRGPHAHRPARARALRRRPAHDRHERRARPGAQRGEGCLPRVPDRRRRRRCADGDPRHARHRLPRAGAHRWSRPTQPTAQRRSGSPRRRARCWRRASRRRSRTTSPPAMSASG